MDSLSKQLEDLTNPSPTLIDPEDDMGGESALGWVGAAKVAKADDWPTERNQTTDLKRHTNANLVQQQVDLDLRYDTIW